MYGERGRDGKRTARLVAARTSKPKAYRAARFPTNKGSSTSREGGLVSGGGAECAGTMSRCMTSSLGMAHSDRKPGILTLTPQTRSYGTEWPWVRACMRSVLIQKHDVGERPLRGRRNGMAVVRFLGLSLISSMACSVCSIRALLMPLPARDRLTISGYPSHHFTSFVFPSTHPFFRYWSKLLDTPFTARHTTGFQHSSRN